MQGHYQIMLKCFISLYYIQYKMQYKKKANPGTVQINKLIAELSEQKEKVKARVQFRHDILESQKRVNYKNEPDRLQGAKKISGLDANAKTRMKEPQKKAKQSLNCTPSHRTYSAKF